MTEPGPATPDRRRTFAPVAGLGVVAAGVATLAGSRSWIGSVSLGGDTTTSDGSTLGLSYSAAEDVPAVVAAGLVLLAAWGVVLFTRRRVRRLAALVGALAAAGLVAAVVHARLTLADQIRDIGDLLPAGARIDTSWSPWFAIGAAAAAVALVTAVLALLWCGRWPEMGSRYDAPGGAGGPEVLDEDATALDLWKALDAGHDPTSGPTGAPEGPRAP